VLEYQFYNQQNSNFWGRKSKSDLLNIIGTLKKIINKDSELIAAVKEASIKKIAARTANSERKSKVTAEDSRVVYARMQDMQSQIKILQSSIKKRERDIKDLEAQLESANKMRFEKDKVIAVLVVVSFVLFLYAVLLQIRLNKVHRKARKEKA